VASALERVAEQVRARRLALDLSQRELAERAHLPVEAISRLERGQGNPTLGTLVAVAKALGADVHELLVTPPARSGPLQTLQGLLREQPLDVQRRAVAIVRAFLKG
jgi:transcriptional regulator with XRE-family HTH domain